MAIPPVTTKADFIRRYRNGEFGNGPPTWNTIEEFLQSGYKGLIHIRNRVAGGPTWYDVPANEVWLRFTEICAQHNGASFYFSAMCPTHLTTFQGEVCLNEIGQYALHYSVVPKPMRQSLEEGGRHCTGLKAKLLISTYMNAVSLSWLEWLLDAYPQHVVEFTCLSRCWGNMAGYNTLFWECRLY